MKVTDKIWYKDYIRTTSDDTFIASHFIKDFLFQHRLRYMYYFRKAQNTKSRILKLYFEYKLYRMSRKYGIEIKTQTSIGEGFVLTHPYNITVTPYAKIGKNVNILKGATIGLSSGKNPGAPVIGNCVYVGINSTILGGVTIGNDVLIAPNTLVTCDVPDHSVVMGNPAIIKHRDNATRDYIYYRV